MLEYYWNQTFFFNLKQSPTEQKTPLICQKTNRLIEHYKVGKESPFPVFFLKAKEYFISDENDFYLKTIEEIASVLTKDVSYRFKRVPGETLEIYGLDLKEKIVILTLEQAELLKEYSIIISKLLNYKWSQLLEQFNFSPKISLKVKDLSQDNSKDAKADAKIRRQNLSKFRVELLKEFDSEVIDFYTGEPLKEGDISVDHVIPWSFMYSDDIWNLVLTSKSINSSKSNIIPSEETIDKLNERNRRIEPLLAPSYRLKMDEAIKNNYVNKFYYQSRM
ncbi:MAG: HNH endonuclease domain-containing protein [bacterium]|nr:HNH endonuclease domain-containing protein [bacterium]MDY5256893.1 HNH endonuclease domain-containing protein [Candidatus Enterosoma sp.]